MDDDSPDGESSLADTIGEFGRGLVERLAEDDAESLGRWTGVVGAARGVLESFAEIGGYLARHSLEEVGAPPERVVDALAERSAELVAALPEVAEAYEDLDRVDEKVRVGLDNAGGDGALLRYLDWLRGLVDAVIGWAVQVALSEESAGVTPDRAERILERIDELLGVVLERWVIPALFDDERSRR